MIRKEKGRVDVYGDRFRARAHQLTPRLLQVARYIHDNREAVMEQTAMEIATLLKTSDATVVRAIQALGFAGLRDLKQTLEQWFGPVVTSSEKMSTTVNTLASDVNASIDFVLEGHQHTCEVLSEPHNRYAMAQAVSLLAQARQVAIFGIGASGILAEYTDWDQYIASMNDGKAAGVINGCWIMSSVQAAADQSGKWAIVNMPKLDGIDGATNYANCGGASWAVSSNCKNTELAFDFLKSTFGSSVELYDDLLPNAGAISSYLPAAESDVYNQPSEFYGGQTVYKDIVEFAGKVPAFDCGAYYSDVRSAMTDAVTNIVQNNADIDSEMQNAQDTVEFNIAG